MIEDNGNAENIVSDENREGKENPAVDETIEDKSVGAKKDDQGVDAFDTQFQSGLDVKFCVKSYGSAISLIYVIS